MYLAKTKKPSLGRVAVSAFHNNSDCKVSNMECDPHRLTPFRRCDQPPAVRAAPDRILPSSAYSVKKVALLYESATLLYEGILPAANRKRESRLDPRRDPRTEKPGRKQWNREYQRVRRSCGKPALFSQNPSEGCPIESSHA